MRFSKQILVTFSTLFFLIWATPAMAAPTRAERSLLKVINQTRVQNGLAPLRVDRRLERAARAHSRDMVRRGYFSHGEFARRMMRFHVRGPAVGENLAWGTGHQATAPGILQGWLASPAHRANLLRPGFRRIGLGRVVGSFSGAAGAAVVTADFAGT